MRNERRYRWWRNAFFGLIVLALTACTSLTPSPSPPSPVLSPSPTVPPPTPTSASAIGPLVITLTIWLPEDLNPYDERAGASLLARRIDDFVLVHPGLQVQAIVKKSRGRGGLLDFLRTASEAAPSVLPDLIVLSTADLRVAAQSGLLQPLDHLIPADLASDLFPFATELGKVGDQTFGLPLTAELEHMAYSPTWLENPPLTWSEVLSAGVLLIFPAGQNESVGDFTLIQYLGSGGHWIDEGGMPLIEEEPLEAVLDFYAQASATGVISPPLALSLSSIEACWAHFQAFGGMTVVDSRHFWTGGGGEAEPAPIPTRNGRPLTLAEGWVIAMVTTDPERQQRAMSLATWLLDPVWYGEWSQNAGYLPVTHSGLRGWMVSETRRGVLTTILESARATPPAALRSRIGPPIQAAVEMVLRGRMSPREAAAQAAQSLR